MNTLHIRICAALPALLLAGCASTPRWDAGAGDSVRATLSAQVANPGAAHNPDPVAGIDGRAAGAAQERYQRTWQQAQEKTGAPAAMIGK